MHKVVLLRHGESIWNRDNIFTGWVDVGLSKRGEEQSKEAGRLLREEGFVFDMAFTSVLSRASQTLKLTLAEMGLQDIIQEQSWRLNERHYGALQGINKREAVARFGEGQVKIWRRSYYVRPPAMETENGVAASVERPLTESLEDTVKRILPYWRDTILPALKAGKKVLVVAHGSTLRAIVKELNQLSAQQVEALDIPKAIPLVYELDNNLKPAKHYYLGDPQKIEQAIKAVAEEIKPLIA